MVAVFALRSTAEDAAAASLGSETYLVGQVSARSVRAQLPAFVDTTVHVIGARKVQNGAGYAK